MKKLTNLKGQDVWVLERGKKVVVPFVNGMPCGDDADGLLGGFLGTIARNVNLFPIFYKSWHKVPTRKKKEVWSTIIKVRISNYNFLTM